MAQIKGSNRIDILVGSGADDRIEGMGGHDILHGLSGDDDIHGGTGNDLIEGGAGTDFLFGDEGNDIFHGGAGDDRIDGGAGGQDMVVLSGRLIDYRFDQLADGMLRITDLRSGPMAEGVDIVANVEMFRFVAENRTVRLNDLVSNRAPVALNDTASVGEDGTVTIAVLGNDTDPDAGDTRTIVSIDAAGLLGSASITPDGRIAYDPGQAFQSLAAGAIRPAGPIGRRRPSSRPCGQPS
jgi:hypothetical protein